MKMEMFIFTGWKYGHYLDLVGEKELAVTDSLPPEPPWPGQGDYDNEFFEGTWQLLRADSVQPAVQERRVNSPTHSFDWKQTLKQVKQHLTKNSKHVVNGYVCCLYGSLHSQR